LDATSGASKAFYKEGSKKAGRNDSERYSLVRLSAERWLEWPNRSCRGEGNIQDSRTGANPGQSRGI